MNQVTWPLRMLLLINLALYVIVFKQWIGAAFVGVLFLASLLPIKIEVDRIGQMIVALVSLAGAYLFAVGIGPAPTHPISNGFALAQAFFCVWLLLVCGLRLFFQTPLFGHPATIFFSLGALFACGGFKIGYLYHGFVIMFAFVALWAMNASDPSRPALQESTSRRKGLLFLGLLCAGVISLGLFTTLPRVYKWTSEQLGLNWIHRSRTGFDQYFRLGSLNRMIQSRRIVLRIRGQFQSALYLRGLVYNRYTNKYWLTPRKYKPKVLIVPTKGKDSASRLSIEYVAGETNRYFIPLDATDFALSERRIRIDRMGLVLPLPGKEIQTISFVRKSKRFLSIEKPGKGEMNIPTSLRIALRKLALKWTKGAKTHLQKIMALKHHLQTGYKYSLSFKRPNKKEPLLDFLLHNKQGHCEYFASSYALLLRSVGIPTRVVGGYLVSEYNSLGKYYIVREQNAHSWVEAWLPRRGWQTFDATPSSGTATHMPKKTGYFSAIMDLFSVYSERLRLWLLSLSITELVLGISGFLGLWIGIRLLRRFRAKEAARMMDGPDYRTPLASFTEVIAILDRHLPQIKSESIEHYANRLSETSLPKEIRQAAPLLLEYAAFRYGKIGERTEIEQRLGDWLTEFSSVN